MTALSLIEAARRLGDVLERENDALRVMDLPRATSFLTEKTAALVALAAFGEEAPDPVPTEQATQKLGALALENRALLRRAIEAQQRVIGIVVRAVADSVADPTYGTRCRSPRLTGAMALSTRA